ncbi:glycosyltransferase family 4 protein [Vagococcus zengguangii]|uniref:Glycosyltransferase family 4 protein n=1 Tax=Vagococcus zengguangii TaxID=2571750 RepID=A0A4D7CX83_9ENTE|nr:glycosyltransferase family 4 protein [Vagococcus zengguangii]QCI87011.1 glycosyltransferase family 4 protein [Vagococcus zengguangii]
MKILFVSHNDDRFGAPKSMFDLIVELKKKGIEIIVLTPIDNQINRLCDLNGIENYTIKYEANVYISNHSKMKNFIKYIRYKMINYISMKKIMRKIDISSIDIIHTNVSIIDFGYKLSKCNGIKHVWHLREFGTENINMKRYNKNYIDDFNSENNHCIAISESVMNSWIDKGVSFKQIKRIYNGLADSYSEKKKTTKALKIVFTGSLSRHKGQMELIDALSILPKEKTGNIVVDIYGDGDTDYINEIELKIKENKLNNIVTLRGYKTNILNVINDYHVGIVCSKSEGFGRVTVEYMMNKLTVIASNTGANMELIENEVNGLIYNYGDPIDLANKLETLLDHHNIIEEYGSKAREKYKKNYTLDRCCHEVIVFYDRILSKI